MKIVGKRSRKKNRILTWADVGVFDDRGRLMDGIRSVNISVVAGCIAKMTVERYVNSNEKVDWPPQCKKISGDGRLETIEFTIDSLEVGTGQKKALINS